MVPLTKKKTVNISISFLTTRRRNLLFEPLQQDWKTNARDVGDKKPFERCIAQKNILTTKSVVTQKRRDGKK